MQKHLRKLLLIAAMLAVPWVTNAQALEDLEFSTGVDNTRWISIPSTLTSLISPGAGDYGVSTVHNLGFSFPFSGVNYTQFSVNADGNLRLGGTVTGTSNYSSPFSSTNAGVNNPKINFFGCDGYCDNSHFVRYQHTVDANDDSVGVIEFCMGTYTSTTRYQLYRWQVHLYHDGSIEVVYGSAPSVAPAVARQVGLCVSASNGWTVDVNHNATHFTDGSTSSIASGNWPASGRYYRFDVPLSCSQPTSISVSNLGATGFDISWTDTSDATSWLVRLATVDSVVYNNVETTDTVSFTGLNPNTVYSYSVAGICLNGDTSRFLSSSIRTDCGDITVLPFVENFDGVPGYSTTSVSDNNLPTCWSYLNHGTRTSYTGYPIVYYSTTYSQSGGNSMRYYSYYTSADSNQFAILPRTDSTLYPINNLMLEFSMRANSVSSTYSAIAIVGVIADPLDARTFVPVDTVNSNGVTTYSDYQIFLNNYVGPHGNVAIMFPAAANSAYQYNTGYVDDLILDVIPTCPRVRDLAVTSISGNEATLAWSPVGSETQWFVSDGTNEYVSTDTSYTVMSLSPNTEYTFSVRAYCGVDDTSRAVTITVRTTCGDLALLPYVENFDGVPGTTSTSVSVNNLPPCWSNLNHGGRTDYTGYPIVYNSSTYSHSGSNSIRFYSYYTAADSNQYAILPRTDSNLYPLSNIMLSFNMRAYTTSTSYGAVAIVGVITNPADARTFVPVDTVNSNGVTSYSDYEVYFTGYNGPHGSVAIMFPAAAHIGFNYNYGFVDDMILDILPTCPRVSDFAVTSVSGTEVSVSWVSNGTETEWILSDGTNEYYSYDTNYTFMGLLPSTAYTFSVRAYCGVDDTSRAVYVTAHTSCAEIAVLPFFYDFEDAPTGSSSTGSAFPNCWVRLNNGTSYGGYPYVNSSTTYNHTPGGSKGLYWYNNTTTGTYGDYHVAVLPPVDTTVYPINTLQLRFWAKPSSSGYNADFYVGVLTNPTDINTFQYVDTIHLNNSNTNWEEYEAVLSHFTGSGSYVAIRANRATSWTVYVDDVTLEEIPACPRTSELVQTNSTLNSITLSWTEMGSATQWVIEYDTVNFVPGTGTANTEIATTIPYTLTGLDSAHRYYIYLHADCFGDTSENRFLLGRTLAGAPATVPFYCDFERYGENGWTLLNGSSVNAWVVDSAVNNGGNKSLYISDNGGLSNNYNITSISYSYAIRTIDLVDTGEYSYSYDWRSQGESHNYDFTRVFLAPAGYQWPENDNPAGGTYAFATWTCPAGFIELTEQFGSPANLSQSSTWRTASGIFRIETPATYNLVFAWANDASVGTQPPTAIDNVVLVHNTCPSPIVSAGLVTSDSIVLVWQPGGNETSWVVTGNSDTMLVTDTFYVFDNLSPNQNYRFTVTSLCDGGDSSAASAINIRTACGPMSVPFRESFDDSRWSTSTVDPLPSCWYKNTNYSSNYPYASTSYNHSAGGSKSMYMYSSNASWTYMVLPLFAPALDSLQVSFWLYKSNTSYAHRLEVGVITNPTDPTSFRLIQSVVPTLSSTWEEFIVPLSGDTVGTGYICIKSPDGEYSYPYLDDLTVEYIPTCAKPVDVFLLMSSSDTVRIGWSDTTGSSSFQVVYGENGFNPDTATTNIFDVTDSTYDFTTLSTTVTYDFYVRTDCGGGDTSTWAGPVSARPGSFNMSTYGSDTITACNISIYDDGGPIGSYSNSANSTLVVYAPHPDSLFAFSGSAYTETSLDQLTIYDGVGTSQPILWQTSSSTVNETIPFTISTGSAITLSWHTDGSVVYDGFEVNITCQSAPECNSIRDLQVSHIAGTSALLTWSLSSGNTGGDPVHYNVTVNGVTDTTTQNPYWITGLLPGTRYTVTVEGVCASTGTSFSMSETFNTKCLSGGDVEISGGTGSNVYYPLRAGINYSYTQELYTPTQVGGPMTIAGVAYHINSDGCSTRNIDLYLGETTQSTISSPSNFIPDSLMHLVYSGTFSGTAYEWSTIYLDTTFYYSGAGYLVVALDDNTGSIGTANFYTTTITGADRAVHYHNTVNINPAAPVGTTQLQTGVQNDIRFLAECDTTATCVAPNVAVFYTTPTEAYVSWAPGLSETSWNVSHRDNSSSAWITDTVNYGSTSILITGLLPNTEYTFRVTGICTDTTLDGFDIARTQCSAISVMPIVEDFESAATGSSSTGSSFVQCWNRLNNGTSYGGYPYVSSSSSYNHTAGGTKGLYWYNTTTTGTYGDYQVVVMPEVDSSISMNTLQVSFWAKASSSSYVPVFYVGVMTDPNDVSTFVAVDTIIINGTTWQQAEVPLIDYTGNGHYAAVKAERPSSSWTAYVDDFMLDYIPTCIPPRSVFATDVSTTSFTLDWVDITPAIEWQIEYGPAGYTRGSAAGTSLNTSMHPVYITGLDTLTSYDFYIRPVCTVGDTARWSIAHTLSTSVCDGALLAHSYNDSWSPTSSSYAPMGYSTYNYGYIQTIIDSAQMAGFENVPITAFSFNPSTSDRGDYYEHMDIYMANVPESDLASGFILPDTVNHVFVPVITNGNLCYTSAGWQMFQFDSSFTWDGHSNVLFVVNRRHGTWSSGASFNAHAAPGIKTRYLYQDGSPYTPSNPTGGSSGTGSYVGDLEFVACGVSLCRQPIITSTTHTYETATVTWNGSGTVYEVNIKESASPDWPATDISVTGNSYTFTGLMPTTNYTIRVRQDCTVDSLGYSDWVMTSVLTDSLPCLAPDSFSVSAVTNANATFSWNARGYETVWEIHVWFSGGLDSIYTVTTNPVTVGGFSAGLTYNAAIRPLCGSAHNIVGEWGDTITFTTATCPDVTGFTTSNVTANSVTLSWNPDPMAQSWTIEYGYAGFIQGQGYTVTANTNTYVVNGLEDETDYDFHIKAICGTDWNSEHWVNVSATTLSGGVTCNAPTGVTVNATATTANVSWTPGEGNTSFELEYGATGFSHGSGSVLTAQNTSADINGLTPNTQYDVYVRGLCDQNTYSSWSTVTTFTTANVGIDNISGAVCTIYPNPTSSSTTISVSGVNGKVRISVVDMNGRTVAAETLECNSDCTKTMDVDHLAQGAYFVRITGDEVNMVRKLVVR